MEFRFLNFMFNFFLFDIRHLLFKYVSILIKATFQLHMNKRDHFNYIYKFKKKTFQLHLNKEKKCFSPIRRKKSFQLQMYI